MKKVCFDGEEEPKLFDHKSTRTKHEFASVSKQTAYGRPDFAKSTLALRNVNALAKSCSKDMKNA